MQQRNEILESGQIIPLYRNGHWEGEIFGYATIDKLDRASRRSIIETWIVTLPDGEKRLWAMQNPDKKAIQDDEPF